MGNQQNKLKCCCFRSDEDKDIKVDNTIMTKSEKEAINIHNLDNIVGVDISDVDYKSRNLNLAVQQETPALNALSKQATGMFLNRSVTAAFTKLEAEGKNETSPNYIKGKEAKSKSENSHSNLSKKELEIIDEDPNSNGLKREKSRSKGNVNASLNRTNNSINAGNNLKNYTFSSETNSLIKGADHILRSMMMKSKESTKKVSSEYFTPKIITNKPDEVILQMEAMVNNYTINNKLSKTKTKNLNYHMKYVLLTRMAIKVCKSKDSYISFGTTLFEIIISYITNIELTKNPFSKIMLHTINITFGKDNQKISISSEDGKGIDSLFKVLNFLIKSI